jgi:hypothetical protein
LCHFFFDVLKTIPGLSIALGYTMVLEQWSNVAADQQKQGQ